MYLIAGVKIKNNEYYWPTKISESLQNRPRTLIAIKNVVLLQSVIHEINWESKFGPEKFDCSQIFNNRDPNGS